MGRDRSRSRERRSRDRRDDRGRSRDRKDDRGRGGEKDRDRRDRSRERGDDRGKSSKDQEERAKVDEKPEDDTYKPGRQVIVKGLKNNPEKNGSLGQLVEFNTDKGRWVVELSAGRVNFKEENLELMPDNSDVIDEKEEPPTAKIYITGLSADVVEADLQTLFGGVGVIAKEKPKNVRNAGFPDQWPFAVKIYKPGRDNGDGCVTFQDPLAAKAAIKTYNRYKWKGSKIGVAYAGQGRVYEEVELQLPWHMREENMGKMDTDGGGGGGKPAPKPGDWKCGGCGADVFASKSECFKCGAPKPGGGGDSKGGGKGDWGKGGKSKGW